MEKARIAWPTLSRDPAEMVSFAIEENIVERCPVEENGFTVVGWVRSQKMVGDMDGAGRER